MNHRLELHLDELVQTPKPGFLNFPRIGQQLRFDVKIVLPAGKHGEALHIKSFETETSNYSQDVADLWDIVSFDRISLRTTNGHVNVKVGRFGFPDSK